MLVSALLIAAAANLVPQGFPGAVPPHERQVLMDVFAAAGGANWKRHDGWGTSRPVCEWYGVWCDVIDGDANRPFVAGLSLALNNLAGVLPASLSGLQGLRSLDVGGNRLSGEVPEPLLARWDSHEFEFATWGNRFTNLLVRARVEYSATGTLCALHDDAQFRLEVDEGTGRALFQSVRCVDAKSRRTYCLVREGAPGSLARLSRALKALRYAKFDSTYDYPFTATTHGPYLTTTAVWGDGAKHSVETYARQGPRDVWSAQQLFLGLLSDVSWDRELRKPRCDFQK